MSTIINLTQHESTKEQKIEGVFEPLEKKEVQSLLTFTSLPSREVIFAKAKALANIAVAEEATAAMIGGAPYLMGPLEEALKKRGIQPLYSFSERKSIDETLSDGSVKKVAIFCHAGWVEA